jgi:2',3'-cyclic-nucleotide 2'-phosphodiesterase (5'-nucleotidase family)
MGLGLAVFSGVAGCSKPAPQELTIAYSNDMVGEIRSCGCAANDFGGLGRRATYVEGLRKRSKNFLLLEGGDFFGLGINYGEQKARLTTQAMSYMDYDGIVVGEKDFARGVEYVVERVRSLKLPVVAANLFDAKTDSLLFPPSRVVELPSGLKVGVIGVLAPELEFPDSVPAGRLRVSDPKAALETHVASLRDSVDLVAVLAHMPNARARRVIDGVPGIDIVVVGHDARPQRKSPKFGEAYVLTTSDRGRYMGVAWATLDPKKGVVDFFADHEGLTTDYADHQAIVKLFQSYDMEVARAEQERPGIGERTGDPFAGSETCKSCHLETHNQWKGTKHGHAFDILTSQNRQFDRDCTPCHTTGFFELGGFLSFADTPELTHVQCEACHGNGSAHVRKPIIKTTGDAKGVCTSCHTEEQTPDFTFESKWPPIAH